MKGLILSDSFKKPVSGYIYHAPSMGSKQFLTHIRDNSYDRVVSIDHLENVPNFKIAVNNIIRILKPEGILRIYAGDTDLELMEYLINHKVPQRVHMSQGFVMVIK